MAADKKTFIRNAQKQVQKGQLDRAIASYKAILKIDAKDEKVHNALGDLYIRKNMKDEGIKEYLWVADYYEKDGFHLRSIAICQKILNLDPDLAPVRLKLADLYSQQRLQAEAKAQYLQVADFFDKKGMVEKALEVFGKIADLDPDNLKVRTRLGAMYEKQSLPSKAAGEYARAAQGHLKKGEAAKAEELLNRALQLAPKHLGASLAAAEFYAGREEWERIVQVLEPLTSGEAVDAHVLKTYAGACLKTGRTAEAVKALETAREQKPSSLPLKTLLGRAYLQGGDFDKGFEIYSPMISDDLKENRLEVAEDLARELVQAAPDNDKAQQRLLEVLQKRGDTEDVPGVYLKLAEIYQERGLAKNAAGALEKYLELKPEDEKAVSRLAALAAGRAPSAAENAAEAPPSPPPLEEIDVEMIDIEGEDLAGMASAEVEAAAAPPSEGILEKGTHLEDEDEEEEIVLDFEDEVSAEVEAAAAPEGVTIDAPAETEPGAPGEAVAAVDAAAEEAAAPVGEETVSLNDEAFMALGSERAAVEPPGREEPSLAAPAEAETVREQAAGEPVLEEIDLEGVNLGESDFTAPAEPSAPPDREIPPAPPAEPAAEAVGGATGSEAEAGEPLRAGPGAEEDLDFDLTALAEKEEPSAPAVEAEPAGAAGGGEEFEEFLAEADFYFQQGLLDEAEFLYEKLSKLAPGNEEIAARLARLAREKGAAETPPPVEAPALSDDRISSLESDLDRALSESKPAESGLKITIGDDSGEAKSGEFSDFLSDLREELDEAASSPEAATMEDEGLSEIFQEFREGLKEQLGEEDFETHYNLGIAYKEMGLLQEALGEFGLSEKSESRRLDSISMMALCLRDMGKESEAVNKLQEGLHLASDGSDEQKGFLYDLADVYEHMGHQGESLELFERLCGLDPGYRDVSARVGRSRPSGSPPGKEERPESSKSKKSRVSYL